MKIDKYLVVIIILMTAACVYLWVDNKSPVVLDVNSEKLIEQINKNQQRLDSIELNRPNYEKARDAKLDSISIMISDLNINIVRTKDSEKYEKQVLFNATDADNLEYFINYINNYYRSNSGTGKDTIR